MKEKRKRFIQVFAIAVIMLLIASASYAYFAAQYGEASSTDIIVNTSTVDNLTFETGDAISISATQSNFGEGSGNQSDDTYASATLVANNDTNVATANYYLYIKIDTNEFDYTTSNKTAELILTITAPDGNEVTSLSGLTYTSVTDGEGNTVSGFDITTKTGLITVASEYLIESTGSNTQEWNIEVILINLDSDQSDNAGKSFSGSIIIQSDVYGYNILQSVGSHHYVSKLWSNTYRNSITKIIFDDSGSAIDDYEEVYDITDDAGYCYYDGNAVYNFESWSTDGVTESSCSTVYKTIDDYYFDASLTDYISEYGEASWNAGDSMCETADGNSVVLLSTGNAATEEQCSGTVYYNSYYSEYEVGTELVGSGEWIESVSSIYAYLVNNGDDTYTVYIESDLPIYGNSDMSYWFYNFTSLETIEGLDKLITSNVINMDSIFSYCSSLTTVDLSNFNTSQVTTMEGMFAGCDSLTTLDLSNFDTSQVTTMASMFGWCYNLTSLDLSSFDTSNVTTMNGMFYNCGSLAILDVSNFDTSNVTDMTSMFRSCESLVSLDLSTFDTSKVEGTSYMFYGCSSLTTLNLSNFDTSNVINMGSMFRNCDSLISLDLSMFDTSQVTTMSQMFQNSNSLISLDLSNATFTNVTTYSYMFYNNSSSITVTVKDSDAYDFITARLSEYNGGTVVIG